MPRWLARLTISPRSSSPFSWLFLKKLATRWLMSVRTVSIYGKIFLTATGPVIGGHAPDA
jgi:hypothetical protein